MEDRKSLLNHERTGSLQAAESKSTQLILIVIIVLTSFATYFNALHNGFVFDDIPGS
jgi:hypothetical protein